MVVAAAVAMATMAVVVGRGRFNYGGRGTPCRFAGCVRIRTGEGAVAVTHLARLSGGGGCHPRREAVVVRRIECVCVCVCVGGGLPTRYRWCLFLPSPFVRVRSCLMTIACAT